MMQDQLAAAVRAVVDNWAQTTSLAAQQAELGDPEALGAKLGTEVTGSLIAKGHVPASARALVFQTSHCHLEQVFNPVDLSETPAGFLPVPESPGVILARATALAIHNTLGIETVSYKTENEGSLFVNLVTIPGQGAFAEKSQKGMRGHTDGVSFPFNGQDDPQNIRIAPAPDVVTLLGLRNPNHVPTTLMPLDDILGYLTEGEIKELMKPQFSIRSQKTFIPGMKQVLGQEHLVLAGPILMDAGDGRIHVRYSHSSVVPATDDICAREASEKLEAACSKSIQDIVVKPGDMLIINNRRSLHGRRPVGHEPEGESRWLLRTYGLNTFYLPAHKRLYKGSPPRHILYP